MKSIENVLNSELRIYLIDVVRKLECIVALLSENDMISPLLIKTFLNITFKHYVIVDMIVQRICIVAASISVEAVIESIASIYESKIKKRDCFQRKE